MSVRIGYSVAGVDRADGRLTGLEEAARDLTMAFLRIQESFEEEERKQFETEGAYGSGGWAPLTDRYRAWKEKKYPGMPILTLKGPLGDSLTDEFAPGAVRRILPGMAEFGSSIAYGRAHQDGVPSRNLPARPPLEMLPGTKRRWTLIIRAEIMAQAAVAEAHPRGATPLDLTEFS